MHTQMCIYVLRSDVKVYVGVFPLFDLEGARVLETGV